MTSTEKLVTQTSDPRCANCNKRLGLSSDGIPVHIDGRRKYPVTPCYPSRVIDGVINTGGYVATPKA